MFLIGITSLSEHNFNLDADPRPGCMRIMKCCHTNTTQFLSLYYPYYIMDKETQDAFKTLGGLVTEGFKNTATKQDIVTVNNRLDKVESRLDKIESDLHYIHNDTKTIPDLFNLIKEQDADLETLKA